MSMSCLVDELSRFQQDLPVPECKLKNPSGLNEVSLLSNQILCSLRSRDKGICQGVPISYSLGEETGLVNISPSQWGLKCQGVMIPGMPAWGIKVICGYTGCTL